MMSDQPTDRSRGPKSSSQVLSRLQSSIHSPPDGLTEEELRVIRERESAGRRRSQMTYRERLANRVPVNALHREMIYRYQTLRPYWTEEARYWVSLRQVTRIRRQTSDRRRRRKT